VVEAQEEGAMIYYTYLTRGGSADDLGRALLPSTSIGWDAIANAYDYAANHRVVSTRWVQQALYALGFINDPSEIDGYVGPRTIAAFDAFANSTLGITRGRSGPRAGYPRDFVVSSSVERALANAPRASLDAPAPAPVYGGSAADPAVPVTDGGSYAHEQSVDLEPVVAPVARRIGLVLTIGAGLAIGVAAAIMTRTATPAEE
jgi:hypothetical protein